MSEDTRGAPNSAPIVLRLPVTRVTAFEDRAVIEHTSRVSLLRGVNQVVVEGLSPLMVDAQVDAVLDEKPAGATIDTLRIERFWDRTPQPAGASPTDEATARAALEAADEALKDAQVQHRRAVQRLEAALTLIERFSARLGQAAWCDAADPATLLPLEAAVDRAAKAEEEAHTTLRARQEAHAQAAVLAQSRTSEQVRMAARAVLTLRSPGGAEAVLRVRGLLPCALWRPAHELRVDANGHVEWFTFATIWQRTEVDWEGIELNLSTDRPDQGARLPSLVADRLYLQNKEVPRKTVLVYHETQVAKESEEEAMPGVDDGGKARTFRALTPARVPSDGRPHQVAVGRFTTSAELDRVAVPDLSEQVVWRARLKNAGSTPLLAGPVTLVREGAYVGTTDIPFVGPGAPIEIGLGSDDRFRVRQRRTREVESRMLARDRVHFVTHVELESTASAPALIHVTLRMPVSEVDGLTVTASKAWCSEGVPTPDADGHVRLPVKVVPGERRTLTLGFALERDSAVLLPDPW